MCDHSNESWHYCGVVLSCGIFYYFFDYFAWNKKNGKNWDHWVGTSDPHFCILSRDCFNLSREYFSLWAIKTSLDRNASALLDPEVIFMRRSSFNLSSLLETTGRYFSKICAVHRLSRLVLHA